MSATTHSWIADRALSYGGERMREMFQLAANLQNPVNLAIGQADFDVPDPIKNELKRAIDENHNDYALAQGIKPLQTKLQTQVEKQFGEGFLEENNRKLFVTSGTSAGLNLAVLASINPGDEIIYFDPFFAMYPSLAKISGGVPVTIDTYPKFQVNIDDVEQAITSKTKMIIVNSPANPTGVCLPRETLKAIAEIAQRNNILIVSDEIYSAYSYDSPHSSIAEFNPDALVIDGFSKSHAMAGLRLAYAHGPADLIEAMIKIQQFTFVCAPHPVQWAGLTVIDEDTTSHIDAYRKKRDWMHEQLSRNFELEKSDGAFYLFPKLPWGTGREFFEAALEKNLILIPGNLFSDQDTHFRLSFAVSDDKLQQGCEILNQLATK